MGTYEAPFGVDRSLLRIDDKDPYLCLHFTIIYVRDQERSLRCVLEFAGAPFHPGCLQFHENRRYARTASYAQVTEPLYGSSRYRYRHYRKELESVIPILEPIMRCLGYDID